MKHKRRIIIALVFIFIIIALRFSGIGKYINFHSFKENRDYLQSLVTAHYQYSVMVFILFYTVSVALSLPIAAVLTFAGGFLFGVFPTVVYSNIGATAGSVGAFLMVRYLLGEFIQRTYQNKLRKFNNMMETYGTSFLLVARLVAVVPLVVINTFAGLTNVSLWSFFWTTVVGIIPGAFVYAYAGRQLDVINSFQDIFSAQVLLAFALLGLLGFLPLLVKRYFPVKNDNEV